MNIFHRGVGLVLTNTNRDLFYLQQKDETYPIAKWQLALSVWGGAVEAEDDSDENALLRELREELNWTRTENALPLGIFDVKSEQRFFISLFEIVLPEEELISFSENTIVNEGYGILLTKEELGKYSWVWDLDSILKPIYKF